MKLTYLILPVIANKMINKITNNTLILRRAGSNDVVCPSKRKQEFKNKTKNKNNKQTDRQTDRQTEQAIK